MARETSVLLDTNDVFPGLPLQLVSGETIIFPQGKGDEYAILLLYRGDW